MINLDNADLETFLAVAKVGSFRAAAALLGCSQPAVTARIQHVEAALGLALFHRTTRRVAITEAGQRLLPRAERNLLELRTIVQEFHDEAQLKRGRVVFGASASVGGCLIPPIIQRFRQKWPGIEVKMVDDFFGRALERLSNGDVDFAVIPYDPEEHQFSFLKLLDEDFLVAISDAHPLASQARVSLHDLCRYPLIGFPIQSTSWANIATAFAEAGLAYEPAYVTTNILSLATMTRAGLGNCMLPKMVVPHLNLEGLRVLPLETRISREIGIATVRGRSPTPAAKAFFRVLRASAATAAAASSEAAPTVAPKPTGSPTSAAG